MLSHQFSVLSAALSDGYNFTEEETEVQRLREGKVRRLIA